MNAERETPAATTSNPMLVAALKVVAALFAALILIQAILAGRGWYVDFDLIRVHGFVGNAVFLLSAGLVALVYLAGLRGPTLLLSGAIFLLVFGQVGLGYAGRESAMSASLHVPNGVLLFGLTTAVCMLIFDTRRSILTEPIRQRKG